MRDQAPSDNEAYVRAVHDKREMATVTGNVTTRTGTSGAWSTSCPTTT